jgi:hypothetical protein
MAFTVFAKSRPLRTAFLLDSSAQPSGRRLADAILDGIVSFRNWTWGGHLNPLVVVDANGAMTANHWDELLNADCDEVYASFPISGSLVEELDARILPWNMQGHDPRRAVSEQNETGDRWF